MTINGTPAIRPPRRWLRRLLWLISGLVAILLLLVARPAWHLWQTARADRHDSEATLPGFKDDASRLNSTRIVELVPVIGTVEEAEQDLVRLLQRARAGGLKISIAGASHSMGGHTIYPDGIALDMRGFKAMSLNATNQVLTVQSGALWSEVIPFLRVRGRAVAVMQAYSSFTVGGSISVNCHGWPANRPPIASTVQSFRLLKSDGTIHRCSRTQNSELFSLALGGYGLFGVILDVELMTVPDEIYTLERVVVPAAHFEETQQHLVAGSTNVGLAYGRLNVAAGGFLQEGILNVFRSVGPAAPTEELAAQPSSLDRLFFRGSVGNDYGKELRWLAERDWQPWISPSHFRRSNLLDEAAEGFANRSAAHTEILMEFFVPAGKLTEFLARLRDELPKHHLDLLNVTLRHVLRDEDTFLRYADQPMHCAVLLFHQPRTPEADAAMRRAAQPLIQAALDCGGRYYLPYRLHATDEQFRAAYPQAKAFFELKRKHDPEELFQNEFYRRLGRSAQAPDPAVN